MSTPDVVPTPVRYLSELFTDALGDVKFPDVDAAGLAAAVTRVDALAADVARLEEELGRARAALDAGRDDLIRLAGRAHAYARVYAEDDEGLRTRLDAVSMPRPRARTSSNGQGTQAPQMAPGGEVVPVAPKKKKKAPVEDEAPLFTDAAAE
jgi:hypothetical protein